MNSQEYDKLAACEDSMWYFRESRRLFLERLEEADVPPGGRLLDAGCGTGGMLARIGEWRSDLDRVGLDFSPSACRYASARLGKEVVLGSIDALPFDAGTFDAIVSIDALVCLERPERGVAEFHRCLKPGGALLLNVAAMACLMSRHDAASHTVRRFERSEVREWLEEAGFEVESLRFWNALLWPLVWVRRKVVAGDRYESDVHPYPKLVDALLGLVLAFERWLMRTGVRWSWGVSLLALARKPKRETT